LLVLDDLNKLVVVQLKARRIRHNLMHLHSMDWDEVGG
jgi:hypothetical protein